MVGLDRKIWEDILKLGIGFLVIININLVVSRFTVRFDLTEEKRFSISPETKDLLTSLDDIVYIDVYLEGDFPPAFQRLQKAIMYTLDEFCIYAGDNIQYRFIDPLSVGGSKGQQELIRSLGEKGIQPTNLFATEDGKKTEKLIFPGAVISFGGQERGVMLLKGNKTASAQERLNQSVEGIEFELASNIEKLINVDRKKIGMVKGHGELQGNAIYSMYNDLINDYDLFDINIAGKNSLDTYDAIIIAKPKLPFSESEIYKIDQYIMHGGKAIFMMDMLEVNLDSISREGTIGFPVATNLENLLFKYGVRINKNYLLDLNSGGFPVVIGNMGDNPQISIMPWPFYPIINNFGDHVIVRNLDAVYLRFNSSVDTVRAEGIAKIPLMYSSPYTKTVNAPVVVSLNELRKEMTPEVFNEKNQVVAYLLQGSFTSLYKNRYIPKGFDTKEFIDQGKRTSIIVCADGDLMRNEINAQTGVPYDLGFDPFLQAEFANADFMKNSLAYLLDEDGLILSRNKEIKIRPLDKVRAEKEKLKWQVINLVLPVLFILLVGVIRFYLRKRKYSSH